MNARLPVASYLFILRKHMLLVLGTVVAVLAGGWWYGHNQVPQYRSVATVQIQRGSSTGPDGRATAIVEDAVFISDQVYRVRKDARLAERVLEHLRAPPGGPGARDAGSMEPAEPPPPDPALFAGLRPASLRDRVAVTPIPQTSYYEFAVSGPDTAVNAALANAFARVFMEVFREEREARAEGGIREYLRRGEAKRALLARAHEAVAAFKKEHAGIDFSPSATGTLSESMEALRRSLGAEQSRRLALAREKKAVVETLASVGLSLAKDPMSGAVLEPALGEDPATDPRLSERVQALDVVTRNEGVREALAAIKALDAEERRLRTGSAALLESAPEVKALRARRAELLLSLARGTEAALLKLSQDLSQTEGVVEDWEKQLAAYEERRAGEAVARAELERLEKAVEAVRAEVEAIDGLVLEAERQRKSSAEGGGRVRVHSFASPADAVLVAPNRTVIYAATAVLALLLAAVLAYVLEYLDDTVKTREDFDRLVRLPFLGYVPHIRTEEPGARDLVVARGRTGSPEVEAFRALRTGIQFSRSDREVRTLLVTSAGAGDGKTTVSINIASAFVGGRGRVLLVDADLRRARVHAALGVDNVRGLTNVLVGEATLEEAVQPSSVPGLDVLASGPIPPNPAEILGSERMKEVLRQAAERWDRVIVDSPPLAAVTDPALLAKYVDGVFLVISMGKTSVRTLQRARETLEGVGASIHGAVLNNADVRISGYYGGYGYGYGYASPAPAGSGAEGSAPKAVGAGK